MSYIQSILNKRLGMQKSILETKTTEFNKLNQKKEQITESIKEPAKEPEPVKEPEPKQIIMAEAKPTPKKNARGAGRKVMNKAEIEKRKNMIIKTLTTKGDEKDIEAIAELKNNCNKEEITQEIHDTKRKLKLLSDSLNFID